MRGINIEGLIKDIDVNGDGEVDYEEFQAMVQHVIFQSMLKSIAEKPRQTSGI